MRLGARLLGSFVVVSALFTVGAADAPGPSMPGPGPLHRATPISNASCEGCHTAIAAEWRASLHRVSFTDETFQRAIGREPDPFCVGCHAPETDQTLGVGCVTCHVPSRAILASPAHGSTSRKAPHDLVRTPAFATEAACAKCHEFDFPDAKLRRKPLAMQRTVSEHRGRSDTCATCHMPKRDGHADHRFAASRDEAFVKSAVTIRARRVDATKVEIVLSPAAVGHAFPTGDLFRRVRVTAGSAERVLARHYASRQEIPGIFVRSEVEDDRVHGGDRVVVLPATQTPTRVRVVYERAEGPTGIPGVRVSIAGAITLFDAEL